MNTAITTTNNGTTTTTASHGTTARIKGGGLFSLPRRTSADGEQLEIDIGDYLLYVGSTNVGEVFVEQDPGHSIDPAYRVEHWLLFSSYTAPSSTNTRVSVEFEYRTGVYSSSADFLSYARTVTGSRYIKASCVEMAP